jgi:hypothetical protein
MPRSTQAVGRDTRGDTTRHRAFICIDDFTEGG